MEDTINHTSSSSNRETVFSWLWGIGILGVKNLPKMGKQLAIQVGSVLSIQIIFWYEGIS
ncbi:MAG: hypothetical protein HGA35_03135, partial [Erysipelotrichaceae bacterium]|nr:hypothetical protein [Erysipelotrichaceae bacterium]